MTKVLFTANFIEVNLIIHELFWYQECEDTHKFEFLSLSGLSINFHLFSLTLSLHLIITHNPNHPRHHTLAITLILNPKMKLFHIEIKLWSQ